MGAHPSPGPHCNLGMDFCSSHPLVNHQGQPCIAEQAAVGGKGQAVPRKRPQEGFGHEEECWNKNKKLLNEQIFLLMPQKCINVTIIGSFCKSSSVVSIVIFPGGLIRFRLSVCILPQDCSVHCQHGRLHQTLKQP